VPHQYEPCQPRSAPWAPPAPSTCCSSPGWRLPQWRRAQQHQSGYPMTYSDKSVLPIRHSETQWNRLGRLQGRRDSPLTANGVRQALALGQHLAGYVVGHDDIRFWASPLGRTMQTASILADLWAVPLDQFAQDASLV